MKKSIAAGVIRTLPNIEDGAFCEMIDKVLNTSIRIRLNHICMEHVGLRNRLKTLSGIIELVSLLTGIIILQTDISLSFTDVLQNRCS